MLSGKRLLLLGFIVVLLIVIPLTVYLVQQQQKLNVGATPLTTISFKDLSVSTTVGTQFSEDININPGGNQISFIKLKITYDATKIATAGAGLVPNAAIFTTAPLQGPTYTPTSAEVTLSVGSSPQNAISQATKIATITFKALAPTGTTPTTIAFAPNPETQVLSIAAADQFNENVLASQPAPATVTITGAAPQDSSASTNKAPVCTALNLDKASTGAAPYTINFTAIGNDPDGTIAKVTFNWGDGPTQDVTNTTTGGGIGTASVNTQLVHIYNNSGTYSAKATLTDNQGGVSAPCTQTITITAAVTGGTSGAGGTSTSQVVTVTAPSATPIVIATPIPTPIPTLAPTGPEDNLIFVGLKGIISTIVGTVFFFVR